MNYEETSLIRFNSKYIKQPSGCWEWIAAIDDWGYGIFWYQDQDWKAHRFSYLFLLKKPIGKLLVLHTCDNPRCVNPDHLFLGTNQDNSDDKISKQRYSNFKLDNNPNKTITSNIVNDIRILRTVLSGPNVGKLFNITGTQVNRIFKRQSWNEIPLSTPEEELQIKLKYPEYFKLS